MHRSHGFANSGETNAAVVFSHFVPEYGRLQPIITMIARSRFQRLEINWSFSVILPVLTGLLR
jgi:hypothetical protein